MDAAAVLGTIVWDTEYGYGCIESGRCRRGVRVQFDLLNLGEQGAASSVASTYIVAIGVTT